MRMIQIVFEQPNRFANVICAVGLFFSMTWVISTCSTIIFCCSLFDRTVLLLFFAHSTLLSIEHCITQNTCSSHVTAIFQLQTQLYTLACEININIKQLSQLSLETLKMWIVVHIVSYRIECVAAFSTLYFALSVEHTHNKALAAFYIWAWKYVAMNLNGPMQSKQSRCVTKSFFFILFFPIRLLIDRIQIAVDN